MYKKEDQRAEDFLGSHIADRLFSSSVFKSDEFIYVKNGTTLKFRHTSVPQSIEDKNIFGFTEKKQIYSLEYIGFDSKLGYGKNCEPIMFPNHVTFENGQEWTKYYTAFSSWLVKN